MEPKELRKLIDEDKQARADEFARLMQEAAKRLNVKVVAVIEAEGSTAVARVVVRAE